MKTMTLTFRQGKGAVYINRGQVTRRVPGVYRWTLTAGNGKVVAASTEGYRKRIDSVRNAALLLAIHPDRLGQVFKGHPDPLLFHRIGDFPSIKVVVQP